jgi:phage anti-repressor protein
MDISTLRNVVDAFEIGDKEVLGMNARDLWESLSVKKKYGDWIKDKLSIFSKGSDYEVFNANVKNPLRGRPKREYVITLDTAKHIALMSKTNVGKQLRQNLINMEEELNKEGFIIKKRLTRAQTKKLVGKIMKSYPREVVDRLRVNTLEIVSKFLAEHNYSEKQIQALISSIYNHCHVIVMKKTATMIVADRYKEGIDENSIITTNQLRSSMETLKKDYHSAINYYTEKELKLFGTFFDVILKKAMLEIITKKEECTPQIVVAAIKKEATSVVRQFSGLEIGTVLEGANRQRINEIVDDLYERNFIISEEEKEIVLEELASERCRKYIVK